MADVAAALKDWSTTAGSNLPADATTLGAGLADNLQQIQATTRQLASYGTIASASTTNLSTVNDAIISVTGTTTITALGTVSAGIWKVLVFAGALTFTYNATSLKLPGSTSITTAAGDVALVMSEGSGNWNCLIYQRKSGAALVAPASTFGDGSASLPSITFTSDTNNGLFRSGVDAWGASTKGDQVLTLTTSISQLSGIDADSAIVNGGAAELLGGTGYGSSGAGGRAYVTGGTGGTAAAGGDVRLTGGQGGSTSGNGGGVRLTGGQGGTSGNGGDILVRGGAVTSGTAGSVRIQIPATDPAGPGTDVTVWTPVGHIEQSNDYAVPTITSGAGTGATIEGNDNLIFVTTGTSASSTIVVTFANAWTNAPAAFANYGAADLSPRCTTTTSTVTITLTSAPASGQVLQVMVQGWQT